MSRRDSDSFLPSGAIPSPPVSMPPSSISASTTIPRTIPVNMNYISPQNTSVHSPRGSSRSPARKPYAMQQHSSHSPSPNPPISPPKTRSASAENNGEQLVEDWRSYTEKLRSQHEGERAHMMADRKRMEEVMAEERILWDSERGILKARIAELEQEADRRGRVSVGIRSRDTSMNRIIPGIAPRQSIQQQALSFTSPGSNAVSVTGSVDGVPSRGIVPQESGRNADGSPFYAPAARNPSRTFSSSLVPSDTLRVDSISAPHETAIRVTSKELTSSDFGLQSPQTHAHRDSGLDTIPETESTAVLDSIDISLIQPELEGVAIKATAVSPTFAAKVLSPQFSPVKQSPNIIPPGSDVENLSMLSGSMGDGNGRENNMGNLDITAVLRTPMDRRLTMNAGHTPNHSISKFEFVESGGATPTQEITDANSRPAHNHEQGHGYEHSHRAPVSFTDGADEDKGYVDEDDGDKELIGHLGLTNDKDKDDAFIAQLQAKLEEAQKSEGVSPGTDSTSSTDDDRRRNRAIRRDRDEGMDKEVDDLPPLRLKQSSNFGRPLGSF